MMVAGLFMIFMFSNNSFNRAKLREMSAVYSECLAYDYIKCANNGILTHVQPNDFVCMCTEDYYGDRCENAKFFGYNWILRVLDWINIDIRRVRPTMWWSVLPFTADIQLKTEYIFHQNNVKRIFDNDGNHGEESSMKYTNILPPTRPLHCYDDKKLPSLTTLYDEIFKREPDQFTPDTRHRNILFQTFYQYFILQFLNNNFKLTITASQLYGSNYITKKELRSFSHGKLKTKMYGKEYYPAYLSTYTKHVNMADPSMRFDTSEWYNRIMSDSKNAKKQKWAMGHQLLSMNPMLFSMSTLWIREHNRVCDILTREWPTWTNDQLYNTAKKIVIGQMMRIMMNDIMNVVHPSYSTLKHKPEIYHDELQNINRSSTPIELLLASAMWPYSLPEKFKNVPMDSVFFNNNKQVLKHGMSDTIKFMVDQEMGMVTHNNGGTATKPLTAFMMKLSRKNKLQSFNNYRRRLGLYPYSSFYKLTNNWTTATILKSLYNSIEDVELLTGMITEKSTNSVSTLMALTNSMIINAILTNDLNKKNLWKAETFGGEIGFNIVKSANIETFICNNLVDKCDGLKVKLYAK